MPITATPNIDTDRRHRWFARVWRILDRFADRLLSDTKHELFADLPDRIVEIGPGRGSNFHHYRPGTHVVAFEPNRHFHAELRSAARRYGISLELRAVSATDTGLPSESVAVVVSTLVLCSVDDRLSVIEEAHRVLHPGGRLIFIEHVGAREATVLALVQRRIRRVWAAAGDGCDVTAGTENALRASSFERLELRSLTVGPMLNPARPVIAGWASR